MKKVLHIPPPKPARRPPAASRRHVGDTPAARKILAALYDLEDTLKQGIRPETKYPSRHIAPPSPYDGAKVRTLRRKLNLTQELFARLIGASTILIQKWESDSRHPDGMARRLMDAINHDPQRWLAMIDGSVPLQMPARGSRAIFPSTAAVPR